MPVTAAVVLTQVAVKSDPSSRRQSSGVMTTTRYTNGNAAATHSLGVKQGSAVGGGHPDAALVL